MKKLIRMLKFAHAAEIAAYHAYEGHWRSCTNKAEQDYIRKIALDEKEHIHTLERILEHLYARADKRLDFIGKVVGEVIGFACYYTGWRLPMVVAGMMEKIGNASYKDIAIEAANNKRYLLALKFMEMAKVEEEHEEYFRKVRQK